MPPPAIAWNREHPVQESYSPHDLLLERRSPSIERLGVDRPSLRTPRDRATMPAISRRQSCRGADRVSGGLRGEHWARHDAPRWEAGELAHLLSTWRDRKRPGWAALGWPAASHRDTVVLHFGEIDVRCHLARYIADEADAHGAISELASRFIRETGELSEKLRCVVIVAAVVPASHAVDDPAFPYRGPLEDRVEWTRLLNAYLRERCTEEGIGFLDATGPFMASDGSLRTDRSDGRVHVGAPHRHLYERELDRMREEQSDATPPGWHAPSRFGHLRIRARAARRQLGLVLRHPSNTGRRWRVLWTVLRYELADLLGRPVVVPFADRSTVLARKGGDSSSRAVFARLPDWPEMRIWQQVLQPGDRFVDVGANVGLYSLLAAELGCEVIAVEPASDMAQRLRGNAARNGQAIELHEVALLDRPGHADLEGRDPNRRRAEVSGSGSIAVTTLDEVVGSRSIRGIKIDVEGNERLVLAGGGETMKDPCLELLQVEWNDTSVDALGEDRSPVAAQLRASGFTLFQADPFGTFVRYSDTVVPPYGPDILAVRGSTFNLLIDYVSLMQRP